MDALAEGKVVALKGLGGFQLLVDARNESAVRTLLEEEYGRRTEPSRVDVSFGCDELAPIVETIETARETHYMAASSLTVTRLQRRGEEFVVRSIRMS